MTKTKSQLFYLLFLFLTTTLHSQTTWTVNTVADTDDGVCDATHCSLREAINAVNNNAGADIIAFNIAGMAPHIIEPTTPLPRITDDAITVDGTTQPNYALGDIVIQATATTSNSSGLSIAASNTAIYGLKVVGFFENNSAGIEILSTRLLTNLQIGAPNKGNIVGDNHHGILVRQVTNCADIKIQANYAGVDPSNGMADIGNTHTGIGVLQGSCTNVLIGGNANNGEGNIVGFNGGGIRTRVEQTRIQGNFIGTDETGTLDLGNQFNGILLDDLPGNPHNCLVGGSELGQGNIIAFNNSAGIFNNPTAINNRFQQNSIYCNGSGIRYGATSQDDNRSNQGQQAPTIDCALRNTIQGQADPNELIEVYIEDNTGCTGSACQGKTFLGETITDANGIWQLQVDLSAGTSVTATATDAVNNTSEFSTCATVNGALIATATNNGPYCQGQSIQLTGTITGGNNQTTYNWTGPNAYTSNAKNPTDASEAGVYQFTASHNGCQIVSTTTEVIFEQTITRTIGAATEEILCPDESILVNGNRYDADNPMGSEMIAGQTGSCDTLVTIDLQFYARNEFQLTETLCQGKNVMVNGIRYDANNPQGTEILEGLASTGCDSLVTINLDFYASIEENFNRTLCTGTSLTINGTVYDEMNPLGTEIFTNGSINGCDSTVQIQLTFSEVAIGELTPELCRGDNFDYLGTIYNENNPTGSHLLEGMAATGCDSLVEITLQFLTPQIQIINDTYCAGDTISINGQLYYETQSTGTELLTTTGSNGCDSILEIALNFLPPIEEQLTIFLCPNESETINGTVYDANNLTGQEVFLGSSVSGCDSLLSIQVNLLSPSRTTFSESLCEGDFRTINGTTYDALNSSGTEILIGAAANGCDSIVEIDLQFKPLETSFLDTLLCLGESLNVNGNIYDENAPTGMELMEQTDGCENVMIQLNYIPALSGSISGKNNLRLGDSLQLTFELSGAEMYDVLFAAANEPPILLEGISNGHTILVNPNRTTTYEILEINIPDQMLCEVTIGDALKVSVAPKRDIYFPTAFSPNGDGINDVFLPLSDEQINEIVNFRIFDRWGNLLYEKQHFSPTDNSASWDGTYRGQALGNEVFLYVTEVVFGDEVREIYTGDVMVLRD